MNDEKINEDIRYKKNKRNITIILTIILLLLIVIILIDPIQRHFAKINLEKEIPTEVLKDIEYNNYEIEGEYFNNLSVQMKDDFENYDYSKKKEIITEVLNRFTNIFNNYKKILIGGSSNNTEEKENKVKAILICKENKYTIDKEFIKNGETYTEEESLKDVLSSSMNWDDIISGSMSSIYAVRNSHYREYCVYLISKGLDIPPVPENLKDTIESIKVEII